MENVQIYILQSAFAGSQEDTLPTQRGYYYVHGRGLRSWSQLRLEGDESLTRSFVNSWGEGVRC